jgi:hypothetical protein
LRNVATASRWASKPKPERPCQADNQLCAVGILNIRPKYQVRLERLAAERAARERDRVTIQIFTTVTRDTLEQVEEERRLYAFAPARSEVLRQLIVEGLAFRRQHRPKSSGPMKPARPKRVPFPIEI